MAVGERRPAGAGVVRDDAADREPALPGLGLAKGLGVTLRHLFKRSVTQQYPHERPDLPARTRGVIALVQENCTVCYKCARACPDWCIYIDAHKETHDPASGGKGRSVKVLDRFAIDYALCMYCGICVEVCPFDALFWSPEFEYAEFDMVELVHEKERLEEWAATVLPPPLPEEGAELPSAPPPPKAAPTVAAPPTLAAPPVAAVPAPAATRTPTTAGTAAPRVEVEPDQATYERVLAEELAKGSPQRMAESRAKSAAVRAARRRAQEGGS